MIPIDLIGEAALEVMKRAAIDIPEDFRRGIEATKKAETGKLARFVIKAMQDNWEAASADRRPMCADTGVPRFYVKVGNEARVQSGFVAVHSALVAVHSVLAAEQSLFAEVFVVPQLLAQPSFLSLTAPGAAFASVFLQQSVFEQVLASPVHLASHLAASLQQADLLPTAPAAVFCFSVELQAAKQRAAAMPAVRKANFFMDQGLR